MSAFAGALRWFSMACLGIFLGAQLTEGVVLVPYWQSLAPTDFLAWYAANDRRLLGFFGPLTEMVVLLTVAAAVVSLWRRDAGRWATLTAAILAIAIGSMFFVYFEDANASFSAGSIRADALPAELARWATWHWARTALAALAFAAAIVSVRR